MLNYKEIATTPDRAKALEIIGSGIKSVFPRPLVREVLGFDDNFNSVMVKQDVFDLLTGRIFIIGGGKAAGFMAEELEAIIPPERITAGLVNCTETDYKTAKIKINKASHPLPDSSGVRGVNKMLALKDKYNIGEKDLVICLISGGASALMPSPVDAISLRDKQKTTDLLINCGAPIQEINAVRKHLSKTKGGQLAAHFAPAKVASLIISDVVGNELDAIGSGPTTTDHTTFKDAEMILEKYELAGKVPKRVMEYIRRGSKSREPETPKVLENARNYLIGDNTMALGGMAMSAKSLGLEPIIINSVLKGDPALEADKIFKQIVGGKFEGHNAIIVGGETTPSVPAKHGLGGRNQHFAALSLLAFEEYDTEWTLAAASTDGIDYVKGVSGAVVDGKSYARLKSQKLDLVKYINRHDSHGLLKKIGHSLIEMKETGTNVGDIMVFILPRNKF